MCVLSQVGASAAPAAHGRLRSVSPGYGSAGYLVWSTTAPPGAEWLDTECFSNAIRSLKLCCVLLDAERGEAACGVSVPVLCGCLTRVIAAAPAVVVCAQSGEMCVVGVGDMCVCGGESVEGRGVSQYMYLCVLDIYHGFNVVIYSPHIINITRLSLFYLSPVFFR